MLGATNITTTVVGNTLGISTHVIRELCTSDRVNMWSKWKPMNIWINTLNQNAIELYEYGITYPYTSNINDIITKYDGNLNGWTYDKPKGGESSPYRLGDFRNYEHASVPPLRSFSNSSVALNSSTTATIGGNIVVSNVLGSIKLSDIKELKDCYFGIIIKNGSTIRYGTSSTPISSDLAGSVALVNAYLLPLGSCEVYPVLCTLPFVNNAAGGSTPPGNLTFYTVPGAKIGSCYVRSSFVSVRVEAVSDEYGQVRWSTDISVASEGNLTTFDNNYVWLRFGEKDIYDPIVNGESRQPLANFVLQPGGEKSFSGTMNINNMNKTYRVWVTLASTTYKNSVGVIVPMPQLK